MKDEIKELIQYKLLNNELDIDNISDSHELFNEIDYNGALHELIDSNIDIYYYDLRKWAVDNWKYVEDAVSQGLVDTSNFDYHSAIQAGQYLQLQEQVNEALKELYTELFTESEE